MNFLLLQCIRALSARMCIAHLRENKTKQALSSRKSQLKITQLMRKTELGQTIQNQCNFVIKALTNITIPYRNICTVKSPL